MDSWYDQDYDEYKELTLDSKMSTLDPHNVMYISKMALLISRDDKIEATD